MILRISSETANVNAEDVLAGINADVVMLVMSALFCLEINTYN